MSSAVLELQGAVIQAIKASAAVAEIAGDKVFDNVPRTNAGHLKVEPPFVTWSSDDETTEDFDCVDSMTVSFDIDCWSRAVGFPEVRRLTAGVRDALHNAEIGLTDNALVLITHRLTRTFRDPDGLTSHSVLTFEAVLEQN